jgi:hypothetical protein
MKIALWAIFAAILVFGTVIVLMLNAIGNEMGDANESLSKASVNLFSIKRKLGDD